MSLCPPKSKVTLVSSALSNVVLRASLMSSGSCHADVDPPVALVDGPDAGTRAGPALSYLHRSTRLTATLFGRSRYHLLSAPAIFASKVLMRGRQATRAKRAAVDTVACNPLGRHDDRAFADRALGQHDSGQHGWNSSVSNLAMTERMHVARTVESWLPSCGATIMETIRPSGRRCGVNN